MCGGGVWRVCTCGWVGSTSIDRWMHDRSTHHACRRVDRSIDRLIDRSIHPSHSCNSEPNAPFCTPPSWPASSSSASCPRRCRCQCRCSHRRCCSGPWASSPVELRRYDTRSVVGWNGERWWYVRARGACTDIVVAEGRDQSINPKLIRNPHPTDPTLEARHRQRARSRSRLRPIGSRRAPGNERRAGPSRIFGAGPRAAALLRTVAWIC